MPRFTQALLCGTALAFAAGSVSAQEAGASARQLDEIVVTARKQVETLQSVPVAVSAVTAQQLKTNLANDLSKVGELAPQVNMGIGGQGTGAIITIRGVSSSSSDSSLDQSVAVEIDNVPISRGQVMAATVFDMASVQVLQGPQALFFGKNSPAGVISLRSADPTSEFEGYATAGYEFTADEKYLEGAISGPLSDTFKARLAFRGSKIKGWIKNVAGPIQDVFDPTVIDPGAIDGDRGPNGHSYAGRLTLKWEPSDDFDATFKLLLDERSNNGGSATSEPFCINGVTQPVIAGVIPMGGGADCNKDRRKSQGAVAAKYAANFPYANGGEPYFKSKFGLASLTLNKRFDTVSLTSTTGYYDQSIKTMYTADWSPYGAIFASSTEGYRLLTQEMRATTDFDGPLNIMAGVYYEHFSRPYFNAPDIFHSFNPKLNNYASVELFSKTKGEYYSAFAQATWNITDELELTGGARWSHDKKDFGMVNAGGNPGFFLYPDGQRLESKYKDSNISPEVTLTWRPSSNQTIYGAYKTGYKAGGISNAFLVPVSATSDNIQFQPEKVKGFEAGYKATTLNRQLRFDLTAYRYNYNNLQVVSYNAETISFTIQNAARARIQGIQGSAEWLATDDLTLRGNFGLNSAKYRSFPTAQCFFGQTAAQGCRADGTQDLAGKRLLRAPKLTFTAGGEYKLPAFSGWATTLSASATHSGSYESASDHGPGGFQKSYWLVNAGVRTGPENGKFELALLGRNLTDTYYLVETFGWSGANSPNQYTGYFNRPREVVVQVTARW